MKKTIEFIKKEITRIDSGSNTYPRELFMANQILGVAKAEEKELMSEKKETEKLSYYLMAFVIFLVVVVIVQADHHYKLNQINQDLKVERLNETSKSINSIFEKQRQIQNKVNSMLQEQRKVNSELKKANAEVEKNLKKFD